MRAAVVLVALLALAPACSPAPPDRATPAEVDDATFLAVTNDALAPLAIGSLAGTFVSEDAGRSWSELSPPAQPAVAVTATSTAVVISTGTRRLTYDLRLQRAVHEPRPWPDGRRVTALASIPSSRLIWALAATEEPRLLRSRDDGASWTPAVPTGLCHRPRALAATAPRGEPPAIFAACGDDGLLVSRNDGLTFERVPGIRNARDIATSLSDRTMLVVATPLVRISHDLGSTWTDAPLVADRVAIDPRNPDLLFAIAPNERLFASKDGGKTF